MVLIENIISTFQKGGAKSHEHLKNKLKLHIFKK